MTKKKKDKAKPRLESRRLAWDRVSFLVPANWELALYKFPKRKFTRIEVEDDYSLRLEAEWTRPKHGLDIQTIQERYDKTTKRLTNKADHKERISGLPKEWLATVFTFREGRLAKDAKSPFQRKQWMITAFYLSPDSSLFCYILLHFYPEDKENPPEVMRLIAKDFTCHTGKLAPWQLFDVKFETPREFILENTQFEVGAKLMVFRWKLRRFYLWHFSIADMILKDGERQEEWLSGYLNSFRYIKAVIFYPGENGEITWRRKRRHPIGHRDEITRWCFKWKTRCYLDKDKNQLVAWVFSYRKQNDLKMIPKPLRFGKDIFAPDARPDPKWLEKKQKKSEPMNKERRTKKF